MDPPLFQATHSSHFSLEHPPSCGRDGDLKKRPGRKLWPAWTPVHRPAIWPGRRLAQRWAWYLHIHSFSHAAPAAAPGCPRTIFAEWAVGTAPILGLHPAFPIAKRSITCLGCGEHVTGGKHPPNTSSRPKSVDKRGDQGKGGREPCQGESDTQLEDKNTHLPKEWPWELLGDDVPIIRRTLPWFRCPVRIWTPACPVAAQAGKCPPTLCIDPLTVVPYTHLPVPGL